MIFFQGKANVQSTVLKGPCSNAKYIVSWVVLHDFEEEIEIATVGAQAMELCDP